MKQARSHIAERAELLAKCPLFADLSDKDRGRLASFARVRDHAPGELLFAQGEPAEGFHVILSGRVKVYRVARDGREQVLHLLESGSPCGEVPVFHGGRFPASAAAVGQTRTLYVPGADFLHVAEERPGILLEMLAVLSMRLRGFVTLIDDLALKEVSARLAKYLLDRARGGVVELDTSKAVLASRLGTIAATLSRTLGKMQDRGVVSVKGPRIRVTDEETLRQLASGEKL